MNGASTFSAQVDALALFITGVSFLVLAGLGTFILFLAGRYHHSHAVDRTAPLESDGRLEAAVAVAVMGFVFIIFVWGARIYLKMREVPANAIPIQVLARQWLWKTQHPEGMKEINELHIPVGYPVRLTMTSIDVIHSLYVPAFRTKEDIIPGRTTTEWFEATKPGTYPFFCAEYCGTLHGSMTGRIIAMTPTAYSRWLAGPSAPPPPPAAAAAPVTPALPGGAPAPVKALNPADVAAGLALFKDFKCGDCHKPDGTGKGPKLIGVFGSQVPLEGGKTVVADEAYIRESILEPNAKVVKGYKPEMPAFQGQLEDNELKQLIAYVESLGKSK